MFGYEYFVMFIVECTRMTSVYLMKNKDEIPNTFKLFDNHVKRMYNPKIWILCSDNGGEYTLERMKTFLYEKKVVIQKALQSQSTYES